MKKILLVSLFALLITSCAGATPAPSITQPAPTDTVAASIPATEIPTVVPTSVPATATEVPKLSLDATKSYHQWDLSTFSTEQQGWINSCMTDPDHCSKEIKGFVDGFLVEGIRQRTGDLSYHVDTDPLINSAFVGKYAEFLFTNKIREVGPLPFAWRKDSLGTLDNFPTYNDKGRPGYLIEGFEWLGHDPNYGTPNALWNSIEWDSTRTGVGENISNFTPESEAAYQLQRVNIFHNQDRDTIYGDPFLIVYPDTAITRGDLMLLTQIAGVSPDVAQEAVVRMYGYDGLPRYGIFRIQYAEETIAEGDNSCMTITYQESKVCAFGTKLLPSTLFTLEHAPQRINGVPSSRVKMLELMNMPEFKYPLRITLAGYPYKDLGDFNWNTFIDGAVVRWDIKIPTVSPDFYK